MEGIEKKLEPIYGSGKKAYEAGQRIRSRLKEYQQVNGKDNVGINEKTDAETNTEGNTKHNTKCDTKRNTKANELTQEDTMLITYGDSIISKGVPSLKVLSDFLDKYVGDAVANVHLLPMYPFTSDDGFSVVDYRRIHPSLGDWKHVEGLSHRYGLMFDAVINHISKSSDWFRRYLRCEKPYTDYFITCDPKADYSSVTRPRALPLLTEFETAMGPKAVWTTFGEDQVDLNFNSPEVLAEILELLVMYAKAGARFIRLDAVGFLWKEPGTSCMHLPKTHELIKLIKAVLKEYAPDTRIITETNVPHEENISYFGNGEDEADLVYQFPLPPVVMYSILSGDASELSKWLAGLQLPSEKVTFFNFLSSHDGIGIRPTEGILDDDQRQCLVEATLRHGGRVSYKDNGDGTKSPYELNINYQDALAGPEESDDVRIGRFLAAQAILLSIQGVPGIYIHSLLGSRNNYYGMTVSDIPRRINREKLDYGFVKSQLEGGTNRSRIFYGLIKMLKIRKAESAFAPHASQEVIRTDGRVFAIRRRDKRLGQAIEVYINVSGQTLELKQEVQRGINLLSGGEVCGKLKLAPYEAAWIKRSATGT